MAYKKVTSKEEFVEFAKTHTLNEIIEKYNLSRAWVYTLCKRFGARAPVNRFKKPRGKTFNKTDMIICLVKGGFTYESIGELFGVSRQYIDSLAHLKIENTTELVI